MVSQTTLVQPEIASARCGSLMRRVALSGFEDEGSTRGIKCRNGHQRGSTE